MSFIPTSIKRATGLPLVMLFALTISAQTADSDWTTYNRTYDGECFSPFKETTTANVGTLSMTN